jgi:hypothetical protein
MCQDSFWKAEIELVGQDSLRDPARLQAATTRTIFCAEEHPGVGNQMPIGYNPRSRLPGRTESLTPSGSELIIETGRTRRLQQASRMLHQRRTALAATPALSATRRNQPALSCAD